MAGGLTPPVERRASPRTAQADSGWASRAWLRPGREVLLLDIGVGGVLVESPTVILPGKRVELTMIRGGMRYVATGRVVRAQLIGMRPTLYWAAIAFDAHVPSED